MKVSFRDYHNNTRMDIKNVDLKAQQNKRDRMMNYWNQNVAENHFPTIQIDTKKRAEMENIKQDNMTLVVKKELTRSTSSIRHQESNASSVYDDGALS